jgi:putative addiction module antidote
MPRTIRLTQIGGSVAAILPKDMLQRLQLGATDTVFVSETSGGILLSTLDPAMVAGLVAYGEAAKEHYAAMAALAKL